jgi:hypothetical protein
VSLEQWLSYKWLVQHTTSLDEISGLLSIADRDINEAQIKGLSTNWRLNIAHNAVLQAANAALAASGYRASRDAHHYRVIQSLELTIGLDFNTIDSINKLHKKRNFASYTSAGAVSEGEADEMLRLARNIRQRVKQWLLDNKPELLEE